MVHWSGSIELKKEFLPVSFNHVDGKVDQSIASRRRGQMQSLHSCIPELSSRCLDISFDCEKIVMMRVRFRPSYNGGL